VGRRHELYQQARRSNPERWTSTTRNCNPISLVVLNPQEGEAHVAPVTQATTILTFTAGMN
jgi:hypothetical protein